MKRCRAVIAVLAVIVWALSAPLALASSDCMAMGAACEGPCGASAGPAAAPVADGSALAVAGVPMSKVTQLPSALLALPEPPPRSTLLPA